MNSAKNIMNQQKKEKEGKKKQVSGSGMQGSGSGNGGGFFTGQDLKPIILTVLCVAIVLVLCIGVGIQQFKPKIVAAVGSTKFTMNDMMYPIYEVESEHLPYNEMYQSYTGKSIWESDYQDPTGKLSGVTNSVGLKQQVIDSEVEYEILYQKASKENYVLTDEEKKEAEEQAEKALTGLSGLQKAQLNISKSKLVSRFEKRALADKYKESKQEELNQNVNEAEVTKDINKEDYRQYDIQYYYTTLTKTTDDGKVEAMTDAEKKELEKKIKKIAADAKKGSDFTKLSSEEDSDITFEENGNFTEKDGWSLVSDKDLKTVKKMKNGEVSEAILGETHYVVVKMINNNSDESYHKAYDSAVEEAQEKEYQTWYDKEQESYEVETTELWDDVVIGTVTTDIVTAEDLQNMAEDSSDAAGGSSAE